jgi:hypothetical protein
MEQSRAAPRASLQALRLAAAPSAGEVLGGSAHGSSCAASGGVDDELLSILAEQFPTEKRVQLRKAAGKIRERLSQRGHGVQMHFKQERVDALATAADRQGSDMSRVASDSFKRQHRPRSLREQSRKGSSSATELLSESGDDGQAEDDADDCNLGGCESDGNGVSSSAAARDSSDFSSEYSYLAQSSRSPADYALGYSLTTSIAAASVIGVGAGGGGGRGGASAAEDRAQAGRGGSVVEASRTSASTSNGVCTTAAPSVLVAEQRAAMMRTARQKARGGRAGGYRRRRELSPGTEPSTLMGLGVGLGASGLDMSVPVTHSSSTVLSGRWSEEQDSQLRAAVAMYGAKNWKKVALHVPDRNHGQCLQRWTKVLQPGLVKGLWTPEEDTLLIELASGRSDEWNWAAIAARIPGRTPKQCRERWLLNLDPAINHSPFTKAEDDLLMELHGSLGTRWSQIKQYFVGRTENAVKTRVKSLLRSKARVWSDAADRQLMVLHARLGDDWDAIASELGDKTGSAVKLRVRKLAALRAGRERLVVSKLRSPASTSASANKARHHPDHVLRKNTSGEDMTNEEEEDGSEKEEEKEEDEDEDGDEKEVVEEVVVGDAAAEQPVAAEDDHAAAHETDAAVPVPRVRNRVRPHPDPDDFTPPPKRIQLAASLKLETQDSGDRLPSVLGFFKSQSGLPGGLSSRASGRRPVPQVNSITGASYFNVVYMQQQQQEQHELLSDHLRVTETAPEGAYAYAQRGPTHHGHQVEAFADYCEPLETCEDEVAPLTQPVSTPSRSGSVGEYGTGQALISPITHAALFGPGALNSGRRSRRKSFGAPFDVGVGPDRDESPVMNQNLMQQLFLPDHFPQHLPQHPPRRR